MNVDRPVPRKQLWIGIALLVAGPVIGLLATALGMADSFRAIESQAAPTPSDLAVGVHISMFGAGAGLIIGLAGLGLLVWALIQSRRSPAVT